MSNSTDRVRELVMGINQDVASYQQMEQLLKEQNSNLIRRNNQSINHNNEQQMKLLHALHRRASQRTRLMQSFRLQPSSEDLKRLAARLPVLISNKLMTQWQKLEASVVRCKKLNDLNGRLLASQQLMIRKVLNPQDSFYQPPQL